MFRSDVIKAFELLAGSIESHTKALNLHLKSISLLEKRIKKLEEINDKK